MALAALVCGIAAIPLFFVFVVGVVAIVLGFVAASQIKQGPLPHDGLGKARAGWILGIIATVGFAGLVIAAVAGAFDDVAVGDLEAGDCVELDASQPDGASISRLPRVTCDEPHTGEVYFVGELAGDDEYPGVDQVTAEIEGHCFDELRRYGDTELMIRERITYVLIYPEEDSWRLGDRSFTCIAVRSDETSRTGSISGDD